MTTTQTQTKNRLPGPLYAAAGVGDLAYQQLRKLPERVAELRERATAGETDLRHDVERLRDAARRNAQAVMENMQAAQDRMVHIYQDLVARGEHVVRGARAPIHVKAEIKTSDEGASAELSVERDEAKAEPPKVAKRTTRPAAAK